MTELEQFKKLFNGKFEYEEKAGKLGDSDCISLAIKPFRKTESSKVQMIARFFFEPDSGAYFTFAGWGEIIH